MDSDYSNCDAERNVAELLTCYLDAVAIEVDAEMPAVQYRLHQRLQSFIESPAFLSSTALSSPTSPDCIVRLTPNGTDAKKATPLQSIDALSDISAIINSDCEFLLAVNSNGSGTNDPRIASTINRIQGRLADPKAVVGVIGASCAGKTTLLSRLALIDGTTAGFPAEMPNRSVVIIDGGTIAPAERSAEPSVICSREAFDIGMALVPCNDDHAKSFLANLRQRWNDNSESLVFVLAPSYSDSARQDGLENIRAIIAAEVHRCDPCSVPVICQVLPALSDSTANHLHLFDEAFWRCIHDAKLLNHTHSVIRLLAQLQMKLADANEHPLRGHDDGAPRSSRRRGHRVTMEDVVSEVEERLARLGVVRRRLYGRLLSGPTIQIGDHRVS